MVLSSNQIPQIAGLVLALVGPGLVACRNPLADSTVSLTQMLVDQLLLVSLLLGILAVVLVWERRGISSLGLGRATFASLAWGLALATVFILVIGPLLLRLPGWLGLEGFDPGLAELGSLPVWYLIVAVVIGGAVEEVLYRGFAVERLADLTGSLWLAASITVIAFAAAHVPSWGWGPALTTLISGTVFTAFYIWRRDLWSNIIAHTLTDFVGIALAPLLAR